MKLMRPLTCCIQPCTSHKWYQIRVLTIGRPAKCLLPARNAKQKHTAVLAVQDSCARIACQGPTPSLLCVHSINTELHCDTSLVLTAWPLITPDTCELFAACLPAAASRTHTALATLGTRSHLQDRVLKCFTRRPWPQLARDRPYYNQCMVVLYLMYEYVVGNKVAANAQTWHSFTLY